MYQQSSLDYVTATLYRYSKKTRFPASGKQIRELAFLIVERRLSMERLFVQPVRFRALSRGSCNNMIERAKTMPHAVYADWQT